MKQRLIVRPDGRGQWSVSGEGVNFYASCTDKESALFVAHICRRDWYPRARVVVQDEPSDVVTAEILREERFCRREWRDSMRSDWNE